MFIAVQLATGWSMHCKYIGEDQNFHMAIALTNKCSGFPMSDAYLKVPLIPYIRTISWYSDRCG